MDSNEKKKKYRSWDDAFRALVPAVRQQSVRTAEYVKVLFQGACASDLCRQNSEAAEYLSDTYGDVAYKCGLYCQIGKALLPEELQQRRADFTEEQDAWYRTYPTEGEELVTRLQGEGGKKGEVSIPCQMIRKACADHMERFDGSGFPQGKRENEISLMGQLTGLAKELDRLASQTRSEQPFEDAVEVLLAGKGVFFSNVVLKVLKDSKGELRAVYKKYIQYTKTLPKTVPLVEKRPDRPFGLQYRPMTDGIVEAESWFRQNAKAEPMPAEEAKAFMLRTGILNEVERYLLYEAADAVLRLHNCGREHARVRLTLFPEFYEEDQWSIFEQVWQNQGLDRRSLMPAVPEEVLYRAGVDTLARLTGYIEAGVPLILDGYHPERISVEQLVEVGFAYVQPAADTPQDSEAWQSAREKLGQHGITMLERPDTQAAFTEDELIRDVLMQEA